MTRGTRVRFAIALLAVAIVINLVVLFRAEESPGWPIAAMIFLGAAAVSLLSQRREP
jgi:hypothetical protein